MTVYRSSIEVPDDMSIEEAVEYAREYIDEIPCDELDYVSDDELDEKNPRFMDKKKENSNVDISINQRNHFTDIKLLCSVLWRLGNAYG